MANAPTPHDTAPDPLAQPDGAIDLLSDLEERLGALRNWQNQSEAQAEKVREQSQSLDQRRREIDDAQASLNDAQRTLEDNRQQLDADRADANTAREELDTQRQQLDDQQKQLDERRDQLDARVREIEDDAQNRQRQIDQEEKQRLDAVAGRERQADEKQSALDESRERIESREHRLDEAYAKLREEESYLLNQQEEHQAKIALVESQVAQFDQRQSELDRFTDELKTQREGLDEQSQQIQAKGQELRELSEKVESEIAGMETRQAELNDVASALEIEKEELKQSRTDLHRVQLDQQLRAEALLAQEDALSKSRDSLIDQAAAGTLGATGAPSSAAGETDAKIEQLRLEADNAKAELAEMQSRIEERELEVRDIKTALKDRVAEIELLEEELSKPGTSEASTEAAPDQAELENKIKAHEAEITDLRGQLDEHTESSEKAQTRILELESQLSGNATPDQAANDRSVELEIQIAERDQQLEEARADLDARIAEIDQLQQQIENLAAAPSADADAASTDAAPDDDEFERRRAELDEQAAQVAADRQRILDRKAQLKQADALIKKRRDKIRTYIAQIKSRAPGSAPGSSPESAPESSETTENTADSPLNDSERAQLAGVEKQRAALAEIKHFLEQSEANMVQRWATQRTGSLVATLIIALVLAAAGSYFAATKLTTPLYNATMSMEINPTQDAADLPPGAWLIGYKKTLLSEPVLSEAINQLDQRGIRIAGTPNELASHLRETLTVEGKPQRVTLAYQGEDPSRIGATLEAFGRGLMIFHMADDRRAGRMSDTATVLQPAAVLPEPIKDELLNYALAIFAGLVALAALVALPVRLFFGRSRRVLDPRNMPDMSPLETTGDTDDDATDNAAYHAITNDGPPSGFSRLPDQDEDASDADPNDEKIFRF